LLSRSLAQPLPFAQQFVERRNRDSIEILDGCHVGEQKATMTCGQQFHHMFWMGDLNYRLDMSLTDGALRKDNKAHMNEVLALVDAERWQALAAADQLKQAQTEKAAFVGWKEAPIAFCPTFKVLPKVTPTT
jgi:hypothetical protein